MGQKNRTEKHVFFICILSLNLLYYSTSNGYGMGHEPTSIVWATQVLNPYSNVGKLPAVPEAG